MIRNKRELVAKKQIEKFLEVRGKYFVVTETELFGPSIEQIIGLSTAEDDALKAILEFLEQPTNNPEIYLLIAKFIRNLASNEHFLNEAAVVTILCELGDAHSNSIKIKDEIIEPVYHEILLKLLEHNSSSMMIHDGSVFKFHGLFKAIKLFENKGKEINGLSPKEWVIKFYVLNALPLILDNHDNQLMFFHDKMLFFEEIYPGISNEFLSIQAFLRLKAS